MNKLRSRVAGLVLAVTAPAAILLPMGLAQAAPASTASTTTKQIAVSTLNQDLRVTLTAIRGPNDGGAPAATVKITAYQQSAGEWKLIGRHTVGQRNAWFWNVLTGPGAICRFSTSNVPPDPMRVRLLVSPSIGCSATYKFHLANGALAAG
jgi:hypothetical protein